MIFQIYYLIWARGWKIQIYQLCFYNIHDIFNVSFRYLICPCNSHASDTAEEPTDPDTSDNLPSTNLWEDWQYWREEPAMLWIPWIRIKSWQVLIFPPETRAERCTVDKELKQQKQPQQKNSVVLPSVSVSYSCWRNHIFEWCLLQSPIFVICLDTCDCQASVFQDWILNYGIFNYSIKLTEQ